METDKDNLTLSEKIRVEANTNENKTIVLRNAANKLSKSLNEYLLDAKEYDHALTDFCKNYTPTSKRYMEFDDILTLLKNVLRRSLSTVDGSKCDKEYITYKFDDIFDTFDHAIYDANKGIIVSTGQSLEIKAMPKYTPTSNPVQDQE